MEYLLKHYAFEHQTSSESSIFRTDMFFQYWSLCKFHENEFYKPLSEQQDEFRRNRSAESLLHYQPLPAGIP